MPLVTAGAVSTSTGAATNSPSISGVTAGNLLVLTVSYAQQTNGNPPTVAGWKTAESPPGQTFAGGAAWQGACIFYLENAPAGTIIANVVPGASSTAAAITAQISEFTTGLTTPALDETAHTNATAGASTSGSSGTTGTTANAGSLIIAALGIADEAGAPHANLGISSPATTGYSVLGANQDTTANTIGYQGSYKFVTSTGTQVANWTWTDSSRYTGTIAAFKLAPKITAQPTSQTSSVGGSATFTVTASTSGGTLAYQWRKDGANVGTNSNSLTLTGLTNQDNGAAITVTATDDNGSTVSSSAALAVPVVKSGPRKRRPIAFDARTPGGLFGLPTTGALFNPFMSQPPAAGGAVNYSLAGDAGAYAFTGRAATFQVSRTLSGSAGAYTFTGRAATLALTRKLSGAAGSYALSGQPAAFAVSRSLSGAAGAYSFSGQAATLTYTPGTPGATNYTLSGAVGAYSFTGRSATFSVSRLLSVAAGSYAFTGRAATLTYTPGNAPVAYALSGAAGAYSISGQEAAFAYSGTQQGSGGGAGGKSGGFLHRYKLLQAFKDKQERDKAVQALPPVTQNARQVLKKSARKLVISEPTNYKEIEDRVTADLAQVGLKPVPNHLEWLLYYLKVEAHRIQMEIESQEEEAAIQALLLAIVE